MAKISPEENEIIETKPEQLIYIGPNIPGGSLHRYGVFKGGLPANVEAIAEKCPAIRGLFVPIANFSAAERSLSITGSAENALFGHVAEYLKGGK